MQMVWSVAHRFQRNTDQERHRNQCSLVAVNCQSPSQADHGLSNGFGIYLVAKVEDFAGVPSAASACAGSRFLSDRRIDLTTVTFNNSD